MFVSHVFYTFAENICWVWIYFAQRKANKFYYVCTRRNPLKHEFKMKYHKLFRLYLNQLLLCEFKGYLKGIFFLFFLVLAVKKGYTIRESPMF